MEENPIGDIGYAHEKFAAAVDALAAGKGDIRARLLDACISIAPVFDRDIPVDLQEDFHALKAAITGNGAPAGPEGQFAKAISAMTPEVAAENAARIVQLTHGLRYAAENQ